MDNEYGTVMSVMSLHCHSLSKLLGKAIKCQSNTHSRISAKVVGHLDTFQLRFLEYYEFGHTALLLYCFSRTISMHIRMQQ